MNPATLTSTNVEPASLIQDRVENVTVSFITVNPIPANGKIVVTFPSGFGLSSGSTTTVSSENFDGGTNALSINGQVITITRDNLGTEIGASSGVSVVLTNIKNPSDLGSTGTYSIKTATSGDATIEEDTAVAADTIAVETNITETTTLTATSTSQNETGIARSSTAALGDSFALGFPRTSPFALGDSSQSGANLGRASPVTAGENADLGFPRSSTAALGDSFVLAPGKAATENPTLGDSSGIVVGSFPSSVPTLGDTARSAATLGRTTNATLGAPADLGLPRTTNPALGDSSKSVVASFPASNPTLGDTALDAATFGRTSTSSLGESFGLGYPRISSVVIESSIGLAIPGSSTPAVGDTAQAGAVFSRTSGSSLGDSSIVKAGLGLADTTTAALGESAFVGWALPRSSGANFSDSSTLSTSTPFTQTSTTPANLGDGAQETISFGRASTPTLGVSVVLGIAGTSTATTGDSFGFGVSFPRRSGANFSDNSTQIKSSVTVQTSTTPAALGESAQGTAGFGRASTPTLGDSFSLRLPRTSAAALGDASGLGLPGTGTATLGDSFGLGFPRTSAGTFSDGSTLSVSSPNDQAVNSAFTYGDGAQTAAGLGRASTPTLGDSFGLGFPGSSITTFGGTAQTAAVFGRSSPLILGDSSDAGFPRTSTATQTATAKSGIGFSRTSTSALSDASTISKSVATIQGSTSGAALGDGV